VKTTYLIIAVLLLIGCAPQPITPPKQNMQVIFHDCVTIVDILRVVYYAKNDDRINLPKQKALDLLTAEGELHENDKVVRDLLTQHITDIFDNPRQINDHLTDALTQCVNLLNKPAVSGSSRLKPSAP